MWGEMFLGEYEYRIDPKSRVPIPPKFRGEFGQGLVLARGVESCISLYPLAEFNRIAEMAAALPPTRSKSRDMARLLFATAFSSELDSQGRVALPQPLRLYADIKDTVVIAGANTLCELWDKESWEKKKASLGEQAWSIFESLEPSP
ncbi:MAG: division/cell wall cluster transcriptional repressor MraZ [Dehalococcoidia bacterium]